MIESGLAYVLIVAIAVVALVVGFAIGRLTARRDLDSALDLAAARTLALLVDEQTAGDRAALDSLPPGVDRGDAWELAGRRGISIREAAEELFVAQARARLDANLDRHHRRHRRPTP